MYGTKYLANLMIWWADNRSHDGAMRFPAESLYSLIWDFFGILRQLQI